MATCLDVCCGGRQFWFDKADSRALFVDNRTVETVLCDGRKYNITPDLIADFRDLQFEACTFPLVVFDPPHLIQAGESSWLAIKYGVLRQDWRDDIRKGFSECFRVLMPLGALVFKWNEEQVKLSEVLTLTPEKPLFGNRRGKTIWCVFQKAEGREE